MVQHAKVHGSEAARHKLGLGATGARDTGSTAPAWGRRGMDTGNGTMGSTDYVRGLERAAWPHWWHRAAGSE